jgi:2-polyprenyl-3-methyl-5-hydroxy-6-metoxy-1,4-benzoquinol methylase
VREITRKNYEKNREKYIIERCKNKKVLHLGCCNSPSTEFKFDKEIALFQRIERVCKTQQGLDIDEESVIYLQKKGYKNISIFDLNKPGKVDFKPDIIVFADTLEHLMNLEIAIGSLKLLMNENTELIITVPNATMLSRFVGNFLGRIVENKDHKVSFTYAALRQLLEYNQLKVDNIILAGEINIDHSYSDREIKFMYRLLRGFYNAFYKPIISIFPLFSECLIMTCTLKIKPKKD